MGCILFEFAVGKRPFRSSLDTRDFKVRGAKLDIPLDAYFGPQSKRNISKSITWMLEIAENKRPTATQLVAEFQGHIERLGRMSSGRPTNIRHSFHSPVAKNDNMPASNLPPHHASTVQPSSIQLLDRRNAGSIPAYQRVSGPPTKEPKPTPSISVHTVSTAKPSAPPKPCHVQHSRISSTHAANHRQRKPKRPSAPCQARRS